jgi:hypothetical protein
MDRRARVNYVYASKARKECKIGDESNRNREKSV